MPTASRNQRSCATRTTAASSDCRCASNHSSDVMSRWLVGSSSSSRSGSPASARANEARVSSPPEKVSRDAIQVLVAEPEPVQGRVHAPRASCTRPRARAGSARARRRRTSRRRRPRPSRPPAPRAPPPGPAAPCTRPARSRAVTGHGRAAGAGRAARRARPWRTPARRRRCRVSPESIRSSVVLPEPLRPDSVRRSLRSSLKETPRSRGSPAMSLARSEAITTAIGQRG